MSDSLLLNLLFSATLPLMCSSPPREVRIAHNLARRRLAELLGPDEYERLVSRVELKLYLGGIGLRQAMLGTLEAYGILDALYRGAKRARDRRRLG